MADKPVDVTGSTKPEAEQPAEAVETAAQEDKHFEPKGAFTFVLLMLLFYVAYYVFMYLQVFVWRGG